MTDSSRTQGPNSPGETRATPAGWFKRTRTGGSVFLTTLFDFSFSKFITVQMFPVLYGVILASTLIGVIYLTVEAFFTSWWRGLFYLFVAGPLGFITVATIARALMEFYIVVFRIAENMDEIRVITERFSGISQGVESMRDLTRLIPFWKTAGSKSGEGADKPDKPKRKKDQNWPY